MLIYQTTHNGFTSQKTIVLLLTTVENLRSDNLKFWYFIVFHEELLFCHEQIKCLHMLNMQDDNIYISASWQDKLDGWLLLIVVQFNSPHHSAYRYTFVLINS